MEMTALLQQELDRYSPQEMAPELRSVIDHYIHRPTGYRRSRLLREVFHVYRRGDTGNTTRGLETLAVGLELLHLFALLHDDWIDRHGDTHRPEKNTPPEMLLLAGDLVHATGMACVRRAVTDHHLPGEIAELVDRVARITISGQVREMQFSRDARGQNDGDHRHHRDLLRDELFHLYDAKTGYYSFVAPLQAGALASTTPEATADLPVLHELGLALGRAFQLHDDLQDIRRREDLSAAPAGAPGGAAERGIPAPWESNLLLVVPEGNLEATVLPWLHALENDVRNHCTATAFPGALQNLTTIKELFP